MAKRKKTDFTEQDERVRQARAYIARKGGGTPTAPRARSVGTEAPPRLDRLGQRLVLGQAPLQHGPGENADELTALDYRNTLEVCSPRKAERLVEQQLGVECVQRHLDDLAQRRFRSGLRPAATISRTRVLRVTTPSSGRPRRGREPPCTSGGPSASPAS